MMIVILFNILRVLNRIWYFYIVELDEDSPLMPVSFLIEMNLSHYPHLPVLVFRMKSSREDEYVIAISQLLLPVVGNEIEENDLEEILDGIFN